MGAYVNTLISSRPPPEPAAIIGAEYETQCRMLCYSPHPGWDQVQARFDQLRDLL
jgi:hypothetical protein